MDAPHGFHLVAQRITVEAASGRQYDAVAAAAVEFVGQTETSARSFRLLELEEVGSDRQGGAFAADLRQRHDPFGGEQPLRLNFDAGKKEAEFRQEACGRGVGPAADQRQPRPGQAEFFRKRPMRAKYSV